MRDRWQFWLVGGLCPALVAGLFQAPARASEEEASLASVPTLRRSGFTVGISTGLAMSTARGYPNDVTKIDLPEYEANTGLGASSGGSIWVGGVLADWLTLGAGLSSTGFKGNGLTANGGGVYFRIETFPMLFRGGHWQDLGVSFAAGIAGVTVKRGDEKVAEGQAGSLVGAGLFYEPWRFWRFATGPDVFYTHEFSRSLSAHSIVFGWRLALYGGTPGASD
jgi:hypothetical protein